jgi:hypothetical protein
MPRDFADPLTKIVAIGTMPGVGDPMAETSNPLHLSESVEESGGHGRVNRAYEPVFEPDRR